MLLRGIITLLLIMMLCLNCWEVQDNQVTAPEIPNYRFSGHTFDIDSHETLPNCVVTLNSVELIYDTEFTPTFDTTDSMGYYCFNDVTPGTYQIEVKRGRFIVLSQNVVVQHEDRDLDLDLPKVIVANTYYQPVGSNGNRQYPRLHGIHWKDSATLAGIWEWKDWSGDLGRWRVVTGFFGSPFTIIGERTFREENPQFWGITYLISYWVCGGNGFNNKIYIVYPGDGKISGEIDVPYQILDLTNDGDHIWGISANGKAIKFSNHAAVVETIYDTANPNPSGISWDGENIWTSDKELNYIYQHIDDFSIGNTYVPYLDSGFGNLNIINGIKYLTFDANGRLWASDGYSVYCFQVI
ncbi:hypothetical protein JXB12_08120 [candidate division KSB1 bacterium]|nr:hypothetical protein [candidate division KSB1 bacterium]